MRRPDLTTWSLGTFHACALAIVLLIVLYRAGGLDDALSGLSTLHGFALFLGLWLTTVVTTTRAVDASRGGPTAASHELRPLTFYALRWGALNGVLFLWFLALTQLAAVFSGQPTLETLRLIPVALPFLTIASLVAFVTGALVGLIFGVVDVQLLRLARAAGRGGGNAGKRI